MTDNHFIEAARKGRNEFWRYLITVLLVVGLVLIIQTLLLLGAMLFFNTLDVTKLPALIYLTIGLLPFAFIPLGLAFGMLALHQRSFMSLINPSGKFNWKRFGISAGLWLLIAALSDIVNALLMPGNYVFQFDPLKFLPFLVVCLLLIPIQSTAEELMFRGYLTQGFGLAWGYWAAWLIPAVMFGLLHGANPEVGAYGVLFTMPIYLALGLLFGWITLRSESLELAIGAHIANNLYSSLLVTFPSSALSTPAIFSIKTYNAPLALVIGLAGMLLYLVLIYAIGKGFFRKGLFGPLMAAVLIFLTACGPAPTQPASAPAIELTDCMLHQPGVGQINAKCGKFKVYEDLAAASGKQIELNVAVVRAVSRTPAADPIFMLAGGPGQAATEAFVTTLFSIERLRFKRDIVLVDQRGTGHSNPLTCKNIEELEPDEVQGVELPPEEQVALIKACQADLQVNPHLYTTEVAMQDLDQVRQALGYEQINLLGVSYGTRAALTYQRMFPQHTRSLILDGVVPPDWALGAEGAQDAQAALDALFLRCEQDSACNTAFPNLKSEFQALFKTVPAQPVELTATHPKTGKTVRLQLNRTSLGSAVRLMTYSDSLAALLPLAIHQAAQGDYHMLASEYLMISEDLGAGINMGMYYSVVCNEDAPQLPAELPDQGTYLDPAMFLPHDACAAWMGDSQPAAPAAAKNSGDTPTLIISGALDPVTPPENGVMVERLLPNSKHLILNGLGHNNFYVGCVPNLLFEFLDKTSPRTLDATCIDTIQPQPFFVSPTGPKP